MLLEPTDDVRTDAFADAFSSSQENPVQISTSRALALHDLATALERVDQAWCVEVLTDDDTVKELRNHFFTAMAFSEFTRDGTLEIRSQSTPLPTLLLSDATATALTGFPRVRQMALDTANEAFVEKTRQAFAEWFDKATEVDLRTPPYSDLFGELETRFDAEVRADFEAPLHAARDSNRPSLSLIRRVSASWWEHCMNWSITS